MERVYRRLKNRKVLLGGLVGLVLVLALCSGFFFWKYMSVKDKTVANNQATSSRIIEAVDKIYLLPKDEQPTVASIQDKRKLDGQAFFANAQDGDYLLVYKKAALAILYREKENRLINAGPVNFGENGADATGETAGAATQKQ